MSFSYPTCTGACRRKYSKPFFLRFSYLFIFIEGLCTLARLKQLDVMACVNQGFVNALRLDIDIRLSFFPTHMFSHTCTALHFLFLLRSLNTLPAFCESRVTNDSGTHV